MKLQEQQKAQVAELVNQWVISEDSPERFISTLDEMFDCWVMSDLIDGSSAENRTNVLIHYRNLQKLMSEINGVIQ